MEIKLCAISDIHGSLPQIPKCDILCICGDILPLDIQRDYFKSIAWLAGPFQTWALNLDCKHIVMIWGNHDFIGERLTNNGTRLFETNSMFRVFNMCGEDQHEVLFNNDITKKIRILQDESCTLMGVKFYGTPWCPSLKNWAFYGTSEELIEKFEKIPSDTCVLLTHCPPKYNTQGVVLQKNWNYLRDFGCQELQDAIEKKFTVKSTTTLILSGHIHSGNHEIEGTGGLSYRNVSLKDEDYELVYLPFEYILYV